MTVDEFKKMKPEYADLDTMQLVYIMEDYMLRQQAGQEVIKHIVPFFKRYQLRWLFYRKLPTWVMRKNNYTSNERCSKCKKGASMSFGMAYMGKLYCYCAHCKEELIKEPNTNINHKLWLIWSYATKSFWAILNKTHIVRSGYNDRYGMFGDESKYVSHYTMNFETGETKHFLRKRKWWEYIFIERKSFNF